MGSNHHKQTIGQIDEEELANAIRQLSPVLSEEIFESYKIDLLNLVISWRQTVSKSPVKIPGSQLPIEPSRRKEWLIAHALSPSKRILESLEDKNDPYFSLWGFDPDANPRFSKVDLETHLRDFIEVTEQIIYDIEDAKKNSTPLTYEMRHDIVRSFIEFAVKVQPKIIVSAGASYPGKQGYFGRLPQFVNSAYRQVIGDKTSKDPGLHVLIETAITTLKVPKASKTFK